MIHSERLIDSNNIDYDRMLSAATNDDRYERLDEKAKAALPGTLMAVFSADLCPEYSSAEYGMRELVTTLTMDTDTDAFLKTNTAPRSSESLPKANAEFLENTLRELSNLERIQDSAQGFKTLDRELEIGMFDPELILRCRTHNTREITGAAQKLLVGIIENFKVFLRPEELTHIQQELKQISDKLPSEATSRTAEADLSLITRACLERARAYALREMEGEIFSPQTPNKFQDAYIWLAINQFRTKVAGSIASLGTFIPMEFIESISTYLLFHAKDYDSVKDILVKGCGEEYDETNGATPEQLSTIAEYLEDDYRHEINFADFDTLRSMLVLSVYYNNKKGYELIRD